jgi:hypothetical protein
MQDEQTKSNVIDSLVAEHMEPSELDEEEGVIATQGLVRKDEQVERDEEYVEHVQKVREQDEDLRAREAELGRQRGGLPVALEDPEEAEAIAKERERELAKLPVDEGGTKDADNGAEKSQRAAEKDRLERDTAEEQEKQKRDKAEKAK